MFLIMMFVDPYARILHMKIPVLQKMCECFRSKWFLYTVDVTCLCSLSVCSYHSASDLTYVTRKE